MLKGTMSCLLDSDRFCSLFPWILYNFVNLELTLKLFFSHSISEPKQTEEFINSLLICSPFLFLAGLHEIQCSLPVENRRIFLNELSEVSFSECKFSLSLTDLFIIIFSGVAVSIAAILSSFFLATLVHCFQRCAPSKDDDDDEDDSEDWTQSKSLSFLGLSVTRSSAKVYEKKKKSRAKSFKHDLNPQCVRIPSRHWWSQAGMAELRLSPLPAHLPCCNQAGVISMVLNQTLHLNLKIEGKRGGKPKKKVSCVLKDEFPYCPDEVQILTRAWSLF